ncbi:MAG: AI-2E family transporter [Chloroflexi bacterium]|nr:AI-2E family transporter [Chloroflexota bacterium]
MSEREFTRRVVIVAVVALLAVLAAFLVVRLLSILVLVFTAWVLAVSLELPVEALQRRGVSRELSIGATLLGVVITVVLFFVLVVPPLVSQTANLIQSLPDVAEDAVVNYADLRESSAPLESLLPPFSLEDYSALIAGLTDEEAQQTLPSWLPTFNVSTVADSALRVVTDIGAFIGTTLGNLILLVFITLFLLLDPNVYYESLLALVPKRYEERAAEVISAVQRNVTAWLGAFFISTVATTLLMLLALGGIMRLPNALSLAAVAGLGTIVPTVGPAVAIIPVILITLADAPAKLLPTVILYAVIGAAQDRLITPSVMKAQLNIPAAALLTFQLIAAIFFGFLGLLLAVPLLAILVTLIRELYVFDVLGKRGNLPEVTTGEGGAVYLGAPEEMLHEPSDNPMLEDS